MKLFPPGNKKREKTHQTADDGAQVKDTPEPSEVSTLLGLIGIGDHDGALGGPEETGADTEPDTSKDVEAEHIGVDGDQQADRVQAVTNTTESESPLNTDPVDNGSTEETEDGESAVEGSVL